MIINHNLPGMNAIRNMNTNATNASNSMQKLSSGLRINKAGDDAAGLAISEKMRGQIRGLDQASANAQDGISMIQTGEGALNETTSILQRMRELATQSSSDTNVGNDRTSIQTEMNQLSSEINRIGNTTEFNTQKILKGGDNTATVNSTNLITAGKLGVGTAGTNDSLSQVTVTDAVADLKVNNAQTATFNVGGKTFTVTNDNTKAASAGTVSADGLTIVLGTSDAVDATGSATALKNALNTAFGNAGISGQYQATSATANLTISAIAGSAADGTAGVITASTGNAMTTHGVVTPGNITPGNKAATGNISLSSISNATSAAGLVGKGFTVDGQVVEFYDGAKGAYSGNGVGVDIHGAAGGADVVADLVSQTSGKLNNVTLKQGTAGTDLVIEAKQAGTAGNSISFSDGGRKTDFTATLQIGANEGQSLQVSISDMRSKALGIVGTAGTANFTSSNSVTDGTNNTTVEAALDVSSAKTASNAITVINTAINTVSAQRANLGAYQNRLEHTINNLGTSSENLTSAESRIRDVDMAKEMATFSKNNILAQAAQAMLAQANQMPQQVLQLLR